MSSSSSEQYSESSSSSSEQYSSASSSSSVDSSSSSSSSSSSTDSSSSSSSSGYCQYPDCSGDICLNLTNWSLVGVKDEITDGGIIYVKTAYFPSTNTQQVELYQDSSYFNLIAIGQVSSLVPVQIVISERNSSNVNGVVSWDATVLDYSNSGLIHCIDISSESSSSSIDSSSSSSESTQSHSSSSSRCCNTVFCEGSNCAHFSSWVFSGMSDTNTTNCTLYVGLVVSGSIQQVRIYKEEELINLTAIGQRTGAGSITIIEQNNSGLSATVTWDGTLLPWPNLLFLSCGEFSSSSSSSSSSIDSNSSSSLGYTTTSDSFSTSSSTSSIDSSSSSSSEEYSESSPSSASISSSSSPTSDSTSSSSSIDSSSTSSESIGNVSTSSSSSGEFWNQAKPLVLGLSSAADPNKRNRLAQTFKVFEPSYDIGKVYVYLYRARGFNQNYYIRLGVNDCFDDGTPKSEIKVVSIHASEVVRDDWYAFEFDIEEAVTPTNGYLSITMRHNGDEDNYILWAYDQANPDSDTIAWTSNNDSDWEEYENSILALRVVGNFTPFDEDDNALVTPPAPPPVVVTDPLVDAQIEYRDAILSFVVDSSGSMGTTDRYNNRKDVIECLINKFKSSYPSDILFDVFTFGGSDIDVGSFSGNLGSFAAINLDLGNPSRSTYLFTVSSSEAEVDAVYENDGNEFTVQYQLTRDQTTFVTFGQVPPINSGTLNLVSGTGDAVISYVSVSKVSTDDPVVAYGFKTFENNHTYNVGEFKVDFEVISPVELKNWSNFTPNNEASSIVLGIDAPNNEPSIDILGTTNSNARKLFTNIDIVQTDMLSIIYVGDGTVTVDDSSIFVVGDTIDILQGDAGNMGRTITGITGNIITFSPVANRNISNNALVGSFVQTSTFDKTTIIDGSTAKLLVRDVGTSREIVFYLVTSEGYFLEWDFNPFEEWVSHNIYFFGETARLPMSFFEKDGTPFPDGTQVDLVVDKKPGAIESQEAKSSPVTEKSFAGQTRIHISSTEGYSRGQVIDIIDKDGNSQTSEIDEVGEDSFGPYIEIVDTLLFDVSLEDGSTITPNATITSVEVPVNDVLATEIPIVDVTPIVNDKDVDPSLLKPYDIDRVPISTPYDDLNTAKEFMQKEVLDMPTVDGNACLRVLPIVEDVLETVSEKEKDLSRLQRYSIQNDLVSQLEQNEGDVETATENLQADADAAQAEADALASAGEVDYIIETPVFTNDGLATSSMQSFATEYIQKDFDAINIPGIVDPQIYSKDYEIYASADFLSDEGRTLARLYLDPFEISFITPIIMNNTYAEEIEFQKTATEDDNFGVPYQVTDPYQDECVDVSDTQYFRGSFATDGQEFTLDYVVADKFILANNKTIKVTLYSNRVTSLGGIAQELAYGDNGPVPTATEQFSNIRPLRSLNTTDSSDNSVTSIDQWRNIVVNNPFEELLDSVNATDDSAAEEVVEQSNVADNIVSQYADLLNAALSTDTEESGNASIFYRNPAQWTLAKQYAQYEFVLPIVNGKASITIPNSAVVSLLMVEASVTFGDQNQHEQILNDAFFVSNPVSIGGISPIAIAPVENDTYEIGANILLFGEPYTIEDNTQVNFEFKGEDTDAFRVEPSASVTDNGWAGGVFIGPIEPVPPEEPNPAADVTCPPKKEITVSVEVFHSSGYIARDNFNITISGQFIGNEEEEQFLFFANDSTKPLYADGSTDPESKATIDLDDAFNPFKVPTIGPASAWVGEDGIERLQGFDQPNNLARTVTVFNASPRRSTFVNGGKVDMFALPKNKNIGHAKLIPQGERFIKPWSEEVRATTSYKNENGASVGGKMASGLPFIAGPLGGFVIPRPVITWSEPLDINISYETAYVRDGITSATVVAETTWRGAPIINTFTLNIGTEFESVIAYPFPKITFESGKCGEENISIGEVPSAIDDRAPSSACLEIVPNQNCILSDYSVTSGLIRTDLYDDGNGNIHTHACTVDENGDGVTTSTIIISGAISNHTHTISNYSSDTKLSHSHELRCVAITTLLPTNNIDEDFAINAKAIYDPTGAEPYGSEPSNTEGNRMMFNTLRVLAGTALPRTLVTKIELGNDLNEGSPIFTLDYIDTSIGEETAATFYTATGIEETLKGFDMRIFVKFAEYQYLDDIGNEVVVPEELVPDGSRITVEIKAFKPETSDSATDPGFLVMGAGIQRDYMNFKVKVAVSSDGYISEREFVIKIVSILQWYPSIKHLVPEFTNDSIYLDTALDSFGFFGSSQLHDAVKRASEEIVQYQTDNIVLKDYKKFIILVTDGDENTSENSLSQAISAVDFIDGQDQVQIIPIQLGQAHASDTVLLQKYAEEGESSLFYLNDSDEPQVTNVCDAITSGNSLQINTTTLTGEIVFEVPNIPNTTVLAGVTVPSGAEATYRIRTSVDNIVFTDWTDWVNYDVPFEHDISLESVQKYVQYEIKLEGSTDFQSPVINGGVEVSYYNPREFVIFFQPIPVNLENDEYISSIHITSEADIPENSTVEYLMTQSDSLRPEEYYDIIPDQHTIIPTRFNELIESEDYKTFTAVNGRWNQGAKLEIYRILSEETEGTLVNPSEYSPNSASGTVTFLAPQDPKSVIFIDIFFASSFRIATRVTNFAEDVAVVHHIGVMYNVSKRIPRSSDGTIINVPISRRLT